MKQSSIFSGKSIENSRFYRCFVVAKTVQKASRFISMANLKDIHIIDEGIYLFELQPLEVKLCKPIFIGTVCLELAKLFMVKYHYKIVMRFGRKNVVLLYTDTDSFIYLFLVDNLCESLMPFREDFDFSAYPTNHPLRNTHNKSVRGKWKDEMKGQIIQEAVFLRSKCYSIKMAGGSTESNILKVAAGVRKPAQKLLTHEHYLDSLFKTKRLYVNQVRFGSTDHQLFTYSEAKLALNYFDDKRYQMNKFETLPYGHCLLKF